MLVCIARIAAMASHARFAEVAAMAGDPARASMLHALMDGRALTASELARAAAIAPQTASGHLARMTAAGLLVAESQGRHRYHRLASPAVARMMESIMQVAAGLEPARRVVVGPREAALRDARTCYDHLAGRLGVALADAMIGRGYLELGSDAGLVTEPGTAFLHRIGIDADALAGPPGRRSRRLMCRPCLDWSERRLHLAGAVGAALCTHCLDRGWVRRIEGSRAVAVTPKGRRVFREAFGVREW
jgi:DNA-binding transcriptional ArsR family regulator